MVPFHMSWRTQGSGTKVWFRIFHHVDVGRDPSMCCQCCVMLTMEEKERKCAGCVISCFQDEGFEEAKSPPIQWRVRKREEVLPNSSNASEPEPDGDGKRELERDPSGGNVTARRKGASEG